MIVKWWQPTNLAHWVLSLTSHLQPRLPFNIITQIRCEHLLSHGGTQMDGAYFMAWWNAV